MVLALFGQGHHATKSDGCHAGEARFGLNRRTTPPGLLLGSIPPVTADTLACRSMRRPGNRHSKAKPQNVPCRASQQGQNARNWQPPIIPRKRMGFRGARTVPSKRWLIDAGCERHQWVVFSESDGTVRIPGRRQAYRSRLSLGLIELRPTRRWPENRPQNSTRPSEDAIIAPSVGRLLPFRNVAR